MTQNVDGFEALARHFEPKVVHRSRFHDHPAAFARECIDWRDTSGLTPYQDETMEAVPREKRVAVRGPHGLGKALQLGVRIPTPSGWSTMGDLRPGDMVFDEHGKPCEVLAKSPVWYGDTYEVEFADRTVITTHGEHEWNAIDVYHRPKTPRPDRRPIAVADWRDHWEDTRCVTTAYMAERLRSAGSQLRWRIPAANALELPEVDLPVDPYLFGYWLGDGASRSARITVHSSDWPSLQDRITRVGYHHTTPRSHKARPETFYVGVSTQPVRIGGTVAFKANSLSGRLRILGVLNNKHIPMIYKRASAAQRIELVRGLMDADGYRQAGGSDEISLSCKPLALDVMEVLRSLGLVVRVSESDSRLNGRVVGRRWRIAARFDFNPYHLKRYDWEPRAAQGSRHTQRTITDIRKVADQPTQCIEVSSPSHLYLAGESMVPTHNSTTAALLVLWFALTRDEAGIDWKIATTAGAWRQLERYLWPEIRKWAKRIRWDVFGREPLSERTEMLMLNIKLENGQAFAVASDEPALIEGVHADSVLYVFDESKAIIPDTFDAAEGAFSGAGGDQPIEAFAVALSTPGEPVGRFYDIHTRKAGLEDWWTRHVTVDEAIAGGRISREWVDQRGLQWGKDSAVYANRVLGEFHTSDSDGVIPLEWIEAANLRWLIWDDAGRPEQPLPHRLGVDVAREGSDKTVLALMTGDVLQWLRSYAKQPTTATTGVVVGVLNTDPQLVAVVDVIGVGGGVVDQLREKGHQVSAFNASESSENTDRSSELKMLNTRSAAWWCLRELLDPAYGATLALPPSDTLTGDLTAPHWKVTSNGRIQIESKDDIRKRIGRSTDEGDAVVQAAWRAADGAGVMWLQAMKARAETDGITVPTLARGWRTTLAEHRAKEAEHLTMRR